MFHSWVGATYSSNRTRARPPGVTGASWAVAIEDRAVRGKGSAASAIARQGRNDLEAPAIALCPQVAEVLSALRDIPADLVRMSGSGATCFALYRDRDALHEAANRLAFEHPGWWQMQGNLR